MSTRSRLLATLGAIVLVASACGGAAGPTTSATPAPPGTAATAPATPVEIRLGHGTAAEEQVWLMSARPDLTPNQGKWYTLKYTQFRASDERLSAYEAGQLDVATMPTATALFAADRGVQMKLVASIVRESTKSGVFATTFVALTSSGIAAPKDLKGKNIGVVGFKTATEAWTRLAARQAGLDPEKDIKLVVTAFPAMGEAIRTNRIDVGALPQPFYAIEKAKGGIVDVYNSRTAANFEDDNLVLAFQPDFLAKNTGVVRAFLSDYVAVATWYAANAKAGRQALIDKKFVTTLPEIYLNLTDYFREPTGRMDLDGLKKNHDILLELKWISKAVDLAKLADMSFLPR